ncbi:hypothetical protein BH23BAC2_BH23BAC2_06370 [soil metagenome]
MISVVISTYNAYDWLEKTLTGYEVQSFKDFEIVIADDGSNIETQKKIEDYVRSSPLMISHVWHEDNGFQKTRILNKALLVCKGEYIVMSDGDCIPRADFIEVHNNKKRPGHFLSGGYYKLPMDISQSITKYDIIDQKCFDIGWLKARGLNPSFLKTQKLASRGFKAELLNTITPTTPSWNGHNSSGWKKDILEINGFDDRMQYGGEDRELGERLVNAGIRPVQIRYLAICVHLDHSRGYVNREAQEVNKMIRRETKKLKKTTTEFGIVQRGLD